MKEKKTPKHPIVRERERELGSNFLREKEDQGFGVGDYWLNPPPPFMGSVFWFSARNCLVWACHPSADLRLFVYFFSHHFSFIFSTMKMVALLKKIEEGGLGWHFRVSGAVIYGGGHQGFWLMGMVVFCGGVKFWVSVLPAKSALTQSTESTAIPIRFMSTVQQQLRR